MNRKLKDRIFLQTERQIVFRLSLACSVQQPKIKFLAFLKSTYEYCIHIYTIVYLHQVLADIVHLIKLKVTYLSCSPRHRNSKEVANLHVVTLRHIMFISYLNICLYLMNTRLACTIDNYRGINKRIHSNRKQMPRELKLTNVSKIVSFL